MRDIERLLQPISEAQPAGKDIGYSPEFDAIKEARRVEIQASQGVWQREVKIADYRRVVKLAEDALLGKSKNLWLAVWLAEAYLHLDGIQGLIDGVALLHALVETFWETVYPEIEDNDVSVRAAPLEWFGSYDQPAKGSSPITALRLLPLNKAGHGISDYDDRRRVSPDAELKTSREREERDKLIEDKKALSKAFAKSFDETDKSFYRALEDSLAQASQKLAALDDLCRAKFGDAAAPSFTDLKKILEEIQGTVHVLLQAKLKKQPDQVAKPEAAKTPVVASGDSTPAPVVETAQFSGGAITSESDAVAHVLAAARFLRQSQPSSPLSYLLVRALRWGEVRAAGEIRSEDLQAPSGEVRKTLRAAAAAKDWQLVQETAESAMTGASGRGWLDLQRYAIKSCEELGFTAAAKAMRSELKCFLADFPQLPHATLSDDTGAANPETLAWLREEGLLPS